MTELLPIDKLRPAPDNPRRDIGDLSELAASQVAGLAHLECSVRELDDSRGPGGAGAATMSDHPLCSCTGSR